MSLGACAIAVLLCLDTLLGLGALVALCMIAMLRTQDEAFVLLPCLGFQWLFTVTGIAYRVGSGSYPSTQTSPRLDSAVCILLLALLALAAGIRAALSLWSRVPGWQRRRSGLAERSQYDLQKLFVWVLCIYAVSWVSMISPRQLSHSFSQFIYRLLEFREVFLFLLFLVVLRQRRGRMLALIAGAFVLLPTLTSAHASFKSVVFILLVALLAERRSLFVDGLLAPRNRRALLAVCGIVLVLGNLAILWQGAIKPTWRPLVSRGELEASRVDRLRAFFDVAGQSIPDVDWSRGVESLARRTSDVPMMMALVLERVPAALPHENGALTERALRHILTPRFLFPDKENLGSDSWLVRKYAGLDVAGEAQGTSIGLSYLVEFYIDYGAFGMCLAAFAFGGVIGSVNRMLLFAAPSMDVYRAVSTVILLRHFYVLEGHFAKVLGGLLMSYAVFAAVLLVCGGVLQRSLLVPSRGRSQPRPFAREGATRAGPAPSNGGSTTAYDSV